MNKRLKNGLLLVFACAITFVAGWKIGTLHGVNADLLMRESIEIATIVSDLEALRDNKIDSLLKLKEIKLDSSLLGYSVYRERNHSWILYPFNKMLEPHIEDAIMKATRYRNNHPDNNHRTNKKSEMMEAYSRIDNVLERYEDQAHTKAN